MFFLWLKLIWTHDHWIPFRRSELSGHEFNSHSEPTWYSYPNVIVCSVSHFILAIAFVSRHVYLNWKFIQYIYIYIYVYIYIYIGKWERLIVERLKGCIRRMPKRNAKHGLFLYIYIYIYICIYIYIWKRGKG